MEMRSNKKPSKKPSISTARPTPGTPLDPSGSRAPGTEHSPVENLAMETGKASDNEKTSTRDSPSSSRASSPPRPKFDNTIAEAIADAHRRISESNALATQQLAESSRSVREEIASLAEENRETQRTVRQLAELFANILAEKRGPSPPPPPPAPVVDQTPPVPPPVDPPPKDAAQDDKQVSDSASPKEQENKQPDPPRSTSPFKFTIGAQPPPNNGTTQFTPRPDKRARAQVETNPPLDADEFYKQLLEAVRKGTLDQALPALKGFGTPTNLQAFPALDQLPASVKLPGTKPLVDNNSSLLLTSPYSADFNTVHKMLTSAHPDRPEPYGDGELDVVSLRRFHLKVVDFLRGFSFDIPQILQVNCIRGLLRGELRTVVDALPVGTSVPDLWDAIYSTQSIQIDEFPRLLLCAASAIELVPAATGENAQKKLSKYISEYTLLQRLALPLTASEQAGRLPVVLPRADELVRPFLEGLKRICPLGEQVGNHLSATHALRRRLPDVIALARRLAQENPYLLRPFSAPRRTPFNYGDSIPPAPSDTYDYDDLDDDNATPYNAFGPSRAGSRNRAPRASRNPHPGEPPYNKQDRCINCALRFQLNPQAGIGHRTEWCDDILGKFDPSKPHVNVGPATPQQIALKLRESEYWGSLGAQATLKSTPGSSTSSSASAQTQPPIQTAPLRYADTLPLPESLTPTPDASSSGN